MTVSSMELISHISDHSQNKTFRTKVYFLIVKDTNEMKCLYDDTDLLKKKGYYVCSHDYSRNGYTDTRMSK
jgi:hypothetical protein